MKREKQLSYTRFKVYFGSMIEISRFSSASVRFPAIHQPPPPPRAGRRVAALRATHSVTCVATATVPTAVTSLINATTFFERPTARVEHYLMRGAYEVCNCSTGVPWRLQTQYSTGIYNSLLSQNTWDAPERFIIATESHNLINFYPQQSSTRRRPITILLVNPCHLAERARAWIYMGPIYNGPNPCRHLGDYTCRGDVLESPEVRKSRAVDTPACCPACSGKLS
ncbi:hypothetical protein EVAR_74333_1 [Eumeta japonica]|uniref:Uncharacterized protein n=1 Tax=Eumeta variegata TaxID=151549 RepID=A0A4C1SF30_EUMVA|nr:hypothetical protein EVAR_74333_1 [Eumeta japonica]